MIVWSGAANPRGISRREVRHASLGRLNTLLERSDLVRAAARGMDRFLKLRDTEMDMV
jgi:hypothetical protein